MKKILILAFALFLNISVCHALDCEGFNGRCTDYFPGTKIIKTKYKMKEGKIEGEYKEYYLNKNLKTSAYYVNGLLEGEYLTYYDTSQLKTKELYKKGRKHGLSELYNPEGILLTSTTYYYDKKHGYTYDYRIGTKVEKYYENDELIFQKEFSYDNILLRERRYKEDGGTKRIVYHYKDISEAIQEIVSPITKREKLAEIFRKAKYMTNETLSSIEKEKTVETLRFYNNSDIVFYSYRIEKIDGKIVTIKETEYDDFGYIKSKKEFTNNLKDMDYTTYYTNGNIESQGHYKENPESKYIDIKEGVFFEYNEQGKMTSKKIFKNNKEIDAFIWNYHPNGNYSMAGHIKNGNPNGIQTLYYDNGKTELRSNFLDGKLHGKSIKYSYEGETMQIETYSNGILNGPKTTYYRNGNTKAEAILKNGKLEGPYTAYWENGKVASKGTYLNNKSTGYWTKYYKNGTLEADCNYKEGKKHGTCKKYTEKGVCAYADTFFEGTLKNRRAFDAFGNEIWSQNY